MDTTVYTSGIHFLGFQHSFIKYPKSVQTIAFSKNTNPKYIDSRTYDGLDVKLEISFQYELQPAYIYKLYMNYGENYQDYMINIAIDTVNKVSNNYTAYNFFLNRTEIGNQMQDQLNTALNSSLHALVKFFQLQNVDLPDEFENAIQQTEVKKQDIEKAKAEQNKVNVEIETRLQKAEQNKYIILNKAYGIANSTISANLANVLAYNNTQWGIIDGYVNLKIQASLNNSGLLNYIKSTIIENYQGSHLIISLD